MRPRNSSIYGIGIRVGSVGHSTGREEYSGIGAVVERMDMAFASHYLAITNLVRELNDDEHPLIFTFDLPNISG